MHCANIDSSKEVSLVYFPRLKDGVEMGRG